MIHVVVFASADVQIVLLTLRLLMGAVLFIAESVFVLIVLYGCVKVVLLVRHALFFHVHADLFFHPKEKLIV